ncbi:MAG: hypothetical protein HQL19_00270 [Candidatus Omnitrophica bacterium]|nr:hypothetical protein [Candidatus Omnitrophota bacterium]
MTNLTLSIDEGLLRKARKVAFDKNTSVNAMVRGYLEKTATAESLDIEDKIKAMRAFWDKHKFTAKDVKWSRKDLYDR